MVHFRHRPGALEAPTECDLSQFLQNSRSTPGGNSRRQELTNEKVSLVVGIPKILLKQRYTIQPGYPYHSAAHPGGSCWAGEAIIREVRRQGDERDKIVAVAQSPRPRELIANVETLTNMQRGNPAIGGAGIMER